MNPIKKVFAISVFFISTALIAQEHKLKLHSISFGLGFLGSASESSSGGFNINADMTTNYNKNLFSFNINAGGELRLFDASENYTALNITYGRALELSNWFTIEGHLGLGYFNYSLKDSSTDFMTISRSTIGIPLRVKLLFYTGRHFAIGLNPNVNFNSLVNTYSGNLIFQYKF